MNAQQKRILTEAHFAILSLVMKRQAKLVKNGMDKSEANTQAYYDIQKLNYPDIDPEDFRLFILRNQAQMARDAKDKVNGNQSSIDELKQQLSEIQKKIEELEIQANLYNDQYLYVLNRHDRKDTYQIYSHQGSKYIQTCTDLDKANSLAERISTVIAIYVNREVFNNEN